MSSTYLELMRKKLEAKADPVKAVPMKKYLLNRYDFFGVQTPFRKELSREVFKELGLPDHKDLEPIIRELWDQPQREFHYFALDLLERIVKKADRSIVGLFEYLIINNSWWDTVDRLASRLVGVLFLKHPDLIVPQTEKWIISDNIWLKRTVLLFQLMYKEKLNVELLFKHIRLCADSDEFFIQKAIGWILREYSKTAPEVVIEFIEKTPLAPLSKRKGLKVLKKNGKI